MCKRCVTASQSADKWSEAGKEVMADALPPQELQTAYSSYPDFKVGSARKLHQAITTIASELHEWYREVKLCGVPELNLRRMIRKQEDEIINFFHGGQTSARAGV